MNASLPSQFLCTTLLVVGVSFPGVEQPGVEQPSKVEVNFRQGIEG